MSDSRRESVNAWYDDTLLSRLNDKERGCIIIVMQRLHQDDLVGHVLGQQPWYVLSFPALAEEDETHLIGSVFLAEHFHNQIRFWGMTPSYAFVGEPETTDEIEQPFFQTRVLSSPCAWATAWRSAGPELKALPRSLH